MDIGLRHAERGRDVDNFEENFLCRLGRVASLDYNI